MIGNQSASEFSAAEREALGLFRATHLPPPDFAARVLAEAEVAAPTPLPVPRLRPARGMAAAAVVALLLGGWWSLRSLHDLLGPPAGERPGIHLGGPDAGARSEADGDIPRDGVNAQS